jgi:hypothetical protein
MYEDDDYDRPRRRRDEGTSGKAIASLVFGLLFCIPIIAPITAIVLGILGLREIGRSGGRLKGQGLAITGLIAGVIGLFVIGPILVMVGLALPAIQKVREAAVEKVQGAANRVQAMNNLKQIALAFHMYHDQNGAFPPPVVYSSEGKPLYSWRVLLLPYLEQDQLYRQFKLDEPWDSPNNKPLLVRMPRVFIHPDQGKPGDPYATCYQVFTGGGAIFDTDPKASKRTIMSITDGTSNTILVVEAADLVPWSAPGDVAYSPDIPLPKFGMGQKKFNVAMADGSALSLGQDTDERTLRAMITANGGEAVEIPGSQPVPPKTTRPSQANKTTRKQPGKGLVK